MGREKYDLIHIIEPTTREVVPLWIKKYKRTGRLVRDSNGTTHYKKQLKMGKKELKKNVERLPKIWGGWVQAALSVLPLIPSAIDGVKGIWHSIFGGKINPNDLPRQIVDVPSSQAINAVGSGIFSSILSQFGLGLPRGGRIYLGQGMAVAPTRLSYTGSGLQPGKQLLAYPIITGSGVEEQVMKDYTSAVSSIPDVKGGGQTYFKQQQNNMVAYEPGKYQSVVAPPTSSQAMSVLQ